jgi:hypothetical protein
MDDGHGKKVMKILRGQGALTFCTKRNHDNARNSAANIGDANKEVKRSDKSTVLSFANRSLHQRLAM